MPRVITLEAGEHRNYDLDDGETFENVLIDQRAPNCCFSIRARQKSGWTVRNVGFLGVGASKHTSGQFAFQMRLSCPDGGEGTVENVYMYGKRDGPGDTPREGTQLGGIYVRNVHSGLITIRHTYIEGFGNNAVYGSSVGKDNGRDGTVVMEDCYHRDNTATQFRIGSPDSVVRHSVGVVDDPQGLRGPYPNSNNRNARGIWGKHFDGPRVENSAFVSTADDVNADGVFEARYIGGGRSHGSEAVLYVVDCDVNADAPSVSESTSNARVELQNLGNEPALAVIRDGGVPTSAQMAADGGREYPSGEQVPDELDTSGTGDGGNGDTEPPDESEVLTITNDGSQRTEYRVRVDGLIEAEEGIGTGDTITEVSSGVYEASGFVRGGTDAYRLHGPVLEFEYDGPIDVRLGGETVNPDDLGGDGDEEELRERIEALEAENEALKNEIEALKEDLSEMGARVEEAIRTLRGS